jgi:RNA polymerase sigma-70 factor, ECF subfamily
VITQSEHAMLLAEFNQSLNEQKLNEYYVECKRKVYCIARSYVKDHYVAEDLSHEILMKCYLARHKFNGNCSFHSWLYRIAINHCIDYLRKGYRQRDLVYENIEQFNDIEVRTPESMVLHYCEKEDLLSKLRKLPSKYQEVIILFYFKDQSLKEIEHYLNVKLSTIKTRLSRAKRMLREMY